MKLEILNIKISNDKTCGDFGLVIQNRRPSSGLGMWGNGSIAPFILKFGIERAL
jgi:hypothetical protein